MQTFVTFSIFTIRNVNDIALENDTLCIDKFGSFDSVILVRKKISTVLKNYNSEKKKKIKINKKHYFINSSDSSNIGI